MKVKYLDKTRISGDLIIDGGANFYIGTSNSTPVTFQTSGTITYHNPIDDLNETISDMTDEIKKLKTEVKKLKRKLKNEG